MQEGDYGALCTSHPEVRKYLEDSVALISNSAPDLGGFFTITASENFTNCWSHFKGKECPRCSGRKPAEVIAELNTTFYEGIRAANSKARLIAWDWGWQDDWVPEIINRLPREASYMCVSEWGMPIERGGIKSNIGEYSISTSVRVRARKNSGALPRRADSARSPKSRRGIPGNFRLSLHSGSGQCRPTCRQPSRSSD